MDHDKELRKHLVALLNGGEAYETFDDAIAAFKKSERSKIPKGAEHSAWQIIDHMSRALEDIIEFSDNEDRSYKEKEWPAGYWSKEVLKDWDETIAAFKKATRKMEALVKDTKRDLYKPFPWGDGQTLLREALLAADHQAYHIGQLVELKRWIDKGL